MNDKQLLRLAKKVANIAYEYASPKTGSDIWLQDRRKEEVNPFYHQTKEGLFLCLYYGQPGSIYTPWGEWNCWGSGSGDWTGAMPQFLQRLGAVEAESLKRTSMGEFGPVYAIMRVDEVSLPTPVMREHDEFLEYDDAKKAWKRAQ